MKNLDESYQSAITAVHKLMRAADEPPEKIAEVEAYLTDKAASITVRQHKEQQASLDRERALLQHTIKSIDAILALPVLQRWLVLSSAKLGYTTNDSYLDQGWKRAQALVEMIQRNDTLFDQDALVAATGGALQASARHMAKRIAEIDARLGTSTS